jgi:ornithine carbamoyltransferase
MLHFLNNIVKMDKNAKSFLSITDLSPLLLSELLKSSQRLKKAKHLPQVFQNKSLIMIFEKPSLRTRLSFEIGMTKLGGHAVYLAPQDIGLGVRESIADVAQVTSRMGDMIMARTFKHETVIELARFSRVPVINALSDREHPCQTLADLLTIAEVKGQIKNLKIAFIGDGDNNVTHSLCMGSAMLGADFVCASPNGYFMDKSIVKRAKTLAKQTSARITETDDPKQAATDADIIYTDTWVSMGEEAEKQTRMKVFLSYQVTPEIMKLARKDAIFMHDLPAYRDNEVTTDVIDGKQAVVFQQAENRMWAQMALMLQLSNYDAQTHTR